MIFIIGQRCRLMLRDLLRSVGYVSMLKGEARIEDCTRNCQYQIDHGMQLAWILFWGYLKLKGIMIPFILWYIDFPKWLHFIACKKTSDATHTSNLFFQKL